MNSNAAILNQLKEFIAFSTVSSDEKSWQQMLLCVQWLRKHFIEIGMRRVNIFSTSANPVVYAEYLVNPSFKTVLFYGHYDVQPADPVNKWHSPPFKAVIKDNYIYGRGASDDKGQLFIHIKAVEKLLKSGKPLPVNIKFLIEGAEEIGSAGLKHFIAVHKELLRCDVAVVSDTKMAGISSPAITYSLRGSLNAAICIKTGSKDLHSGTFGGYVPNAALTLCNFISSLYNADDTIAVPGFYDDVKIPSQHEREFIQANGIPDKKLLNDAGVFTLWGEKKYSLHERSTIRPSLSVTGINAGFQGKGTKNSIPFTATVKLNFRLVPDQLPEKIAMLLNDYVEKLLPGAAVKKVYSSFNKPVSAAVSSPYVKAAANAYSKVFKHKTAFLQNGGTVGAVDYLQTILDVPVVLMGFAQADDNMHAPDEKFYLPNFFRGIDTVIHFIKNISAIQNVIKSKQ
jgi:acetylornithine deacetylase/succinyl-diaminopimelate desuccinylase-like protein